MCVGGGIFNRLIDIATCCRLSLRPAEGALLGGAELQAPQLHSTGGADLYRPALRIREGGGEHEEQRRIEEQLFF